MFANVLYTQWKWAAWAVIVATLASVALPLMTVQGAGLVNPAGVDVLQMMASVEGVGTFYPLVALAAGITIALLTWAPDHNGGHVYALSLPVPRWHYALYRFGAGTVLLVPAALGLWFGALLAASLSTIPQGLHAYPTVIAIRYTLALLLGYSVFFALAAGTVRTAVIILAVVPTALLGTNQMILLAGGPDLLGAAWAVVARLPGPLELLFERWMLINV